MTKILIYTVVFVLGAVSGALGCLAFFTYIRNDIPNTLKDLDEANQYLEKYVPEINLMSATESVELAIKGVELINNTKNSEVKTLLMNEIGGFYYNYTYEDERELNDKIINDILDRIEEKAKTDPVFQEIVRYKPEE